jgi:predicted RNase H-like HicB family nuclease
MISQYIQSAIRTATYEYSEEDRVFYGEIPNCRGVYGEGETLEDCREDLISFLEIWVIYGLRLNLDLPEFEGNSLIIERTPHTFNE